MEYLQAIITRQLRLQRETFGLDPCSLGGDARVEFVRWNVLALEDELHEALNECNWKPWASGDRFDSDAMFGELIDALHFLVNLFLATVEHVGDFTSVDLVAGELATAIADGYTHKVEINRQRQVDGYDGVSGKCPSCRRDLNDVRPTVREDAGYSSLDCSSCGYHITTWKVGGG